MPKYLQIQIPKECEESWDTMRKQQHGKFCNSCQKTVIDFTRMTDEQLVQFFKKRKDNVCGRFTSDQLDTDILTPSKKIPWLKYLFQITIPAFLFSSKIMAQGNVKVQERSHISQTNPKQSKKFFSGIKINEDVYTDKTLINPQAYQVKQNKCTVDSGLQPLVGRVGGVVIGFRIQKAKMFKPSKSNVNKTFVIYPNPIVSSSELNIQWSNTINGDQTIEIYNEPGMLLQREIIALAKDSRRININLTELLPAIYTISIIDNKTHKSSSQQFIVL